MNKFIHTKLFGKREPLPDGNFKWVKLGEKQTTYLWAIKDGYLVVNGKELRIEHAHGIVFALRKTKIKASNLDATLDKFTKDKFWHDDAARIFNWVIAYGRKEERP